MKSMIFPCQGQHSTIGQKNTRQASGPVVNRIHESMPGCGARAWTGSWRLASSPPYAQCSYCKQLSMCLLALQLEGRTARPTLCNCKAVHETRRPLFRASCNNNSQSLWLHVTSVWQKNKPNLMERSLMMNWKTFRVFDWRDNNAPTFSRTIARLQLWHLDCMPNRSSNATRILTHMEGHHKHGMVPWQGRSDHQEVRAVCPRHSHPGNVWQIAQAAIPRMAERLVISLPGMETQLSPRMQTGHGHLACR